MEQNMWILSGALVGMFRYIDGKPFLSILKITVRIWEYQKGKKENVKTL